MALGANIDRVRTVEAGLQRRIAAALAGTLFGVFLLYGVGFAGPEAIHNAAHDSRHAFTFPCH
jgi:cobalt transporter subunit CbtB